MSSNYDRDKKSIMKYQKDNIVYVNIAMKREEKERWQHYAKSLGIPLGTLIKQLMDKEISKS